MPGRLARSSARQVTLQKNVSGDKIRVPFLYINYGTFYMKSYKIGCPRLHEIIRGALKVGPSAYVGESEDCGKYVGKLLERR